MVAGGIGACIAACAVPGSPTLFGGLFGGGFVAIVGGWLCLKKSVENEGPGIEYPDSCSFG